MEFKKGDKVLIKGDINDMTDHLDGKIGTVLEVHPDIKDMEVKVPRVAGTWQIWFHNATVVED